MDNSLIASKIIQVTGLGKTLIIGSDIDGLVSELFDYGKNIFYLSESTQELKVNFSKKRYSKGSLLSLPYDDNYFNTIVLVDSLENCQETNLNNAISEIYRVSIESIFVVINSGFTRKWWETKFFKNGFRKHADYYTITNYESLNDEEFPVIIPLNKISKSTLLKYPLSSLEEERGLHMDMTRDTGERSDAHIARYRWATEYVKKGDRVLDAACGLGYGCFLIDQLTEASLVHGVDNSDYAIEYANINFKPNNNLYYDILTLPYDLEKIQSNSFEVIISFETLEHVQHPQKLISEFFRLLTPGGRLIVSVPNDWSDETGTDPNPHHLHVYDWTKLTKQVSKKFILENAFAQTASRCKIAALNSEWHERPRSLKQVSLTPNQNKDCEWWLLTAMKNPLDYTNIYKERVFNNVCSSSHQSLKYNDYYKFPWIMHSLVNSGYRIKNLNALDDISNNIIDNVLSDTNDHAAALCIKAYIVYQNKSAGILKQRKIIIEIDKFIVVSSNDKMKLRWKVSLLFVRGKLYQKVGSLNAAKKSFLNCTEHDALKFGVHLATKLTESFYLAGMIACNQLRHDEAKEIWTNGVEYGKKLLDVSLEDILINKNYPNRFHHGDGVREYIVAWDNIARCANGIHYLNNKTIKALNGIDTCFQTDRITVSNNTTIKQQSSSEQLFKISSSHYKYIAKYLTNHNIHKLIIYGAGEIGEKIYMHCKQLNPNMDIIFIDERARKEEFSLFSCNVYPPEWMINFKNTEYKSIVIASNRYYDEIFYFLKVLGYTDCIVNTMYTKNINKN